MPAAVSVDVLTLVDQTLPLPLVSVIRSFSGEPLALA